MTLCQLRRSAMLLLRVVCAWRLEDIGRLFDLHKGHVSREIDRARDELADLLRDAGIDPSQYAAEEPAQELKKQLAFVRLLPTETRALKRSARQAALSESKQARVWMLAGGLAAAIAAEIVPEEDLADEAEAA